MFFFKRLKVSAHTCVCVCVSERSCTYIRGESQFLSDVLSRLELVAKVRAREVIMMLITVQALKTVRQKGKYFRPFSMEL